jgi:N-methylhydantoinase B
VRAGLVSVAAARRDYGVAIEDGRIDRAATAVLRGAGRSPPAFGFGPERAAWESVFDDETATGLAHRLLLLPPGSRAETKRRIVEQVVPGIEEVGTRGMATLFPDPAAQKARLRALIERDLPKA